MAQRKLFQAPSRYFDYSTFYITVLQYPTSEIASFLETIDKYPNQKLANEHRKGFWIAAQLHSSSAKRDLAKGIPKALHDSSSLEWYQQQARYSALD